MKNINLPYLSKMQTALDDYKKGWANDYYLDPLKCCVSVIASLIKYGRLNNDKEHKKISDSKSSTSYHFQDHKAPYQPNLLINAFLRDKQAQYKTNDRHDLPIVAPFIYPICDTLNIKPNWFRITDFNRQEKLSQMRLYLSICNVPESILREYYDPIANRESIDTRPVMSFLLPGQFNPNSTQAIKEHIQRLAKMEFFEGEGDRDPAVKIAKIDHHYFVQCLNYLSAAKFDLIKCDCCPYTGIDLLQSQFLLSKVEWNNYYQYSQTARVAFEGAHIYPIRGSSRITTIESLLLLCPNCHNFFDRIQKEYPTLDHRDILERIRNSLPY